MVARLELEAKMSEHKRTVRQLTATEKSRLTTAIEEERQAIPENREQGRRLRAEHEASVKRENSE
jgi:hypothetical protein